MLPGCLKAGCLKVSMVERQVARPDPLPATLYLPFYLLCPVGRPLSPV